MSQEQKKPHPYDLSKTDRIFMIAAGAHEAHRAYCAALGELLKPHWSRCSPELQSQRIRAVEKILVNPTPPSEDELRARHDSWIEGMKNAGWTQGDSMNPIDKQMKYLVPWKDLPDAQKRKDIVFHEAVMAMALLLGWPTDTTDIINWLVPDHRSHKLVGMEPITGDYYDLVCSCGENIRIGFQVLWAMGMAQGAFERALEVLPMPERSYLLNVMAAVYRHQHESLEWPRVDEALQDYVKRVAPEVPYHHVTSVQDGGEALQGVFDAVAQIASELPDGGAPTPEHMKLMKEKMVAFVAWQISVSPAVAMPPMPGASAADQVQPE